MNAARRETEAGSGGTSVADRVVLTFLGLLTLALYGTIALGATTGWVRSLDDRPEVTKDFVSLAVAGRLTATEPEHLYDLDRQHELQHELAGADAVDRPFANPPFVATYARALTGGGLRTGYTILNITTLAGVAVISALVARAAAPLRLLVRANFVVGTVGSIAVASTLGEGAISMFAALGIALLVVGVRAGDDTLAGLGLALSATKPHLAILPTLLLLARHAHRALGRGVAFGVLIAAPSLLTPGIGSWLRYPAVLLGVGGPDSAAADYSHYWWNLASVLHHVAPDAGGIITSVSWLAFLGGLAAAVVLHRRRPERADIVSLLVLGIIMSPHANPHDTLWLPLAFALVRSEASWSRRGLAQRTLLTTLALTWPVLGLLAMAHAAGGGSIAAVAAMGAFAIIAMIGRPGDAPNPAMSAEPSTSDVEVAAALRPAPVVTG